MSDDGDMGVSNEETQEVIIDRDLGATVRVFIETYSFEKREIYDGLIRAARAIRGGKSLDDIG